MTNNQSPIFSNSTPIDEMDVATKQWFLTLNWHRTDIKKRGLLNKFKNSKQIVDLDLSCLLCNRFGEVVERVWFKNVRDQAESIRHHGDELLGAKPITPNPDDNSLYQESTVFSDTYDRQMNQERIVMYLPRIPNEICHVVMVLSSYTDNPLNVAEQGHCQLMDDEGNVIFDVYVSNLPSDCQALCLARLSRMDNRWHFQQLNLPLNHHRLQHFEEEIRDNIMK